MAAHVVFSVLTLYMMMILLRWFGPWLEVDTDAGRLAWIGRATEPLIQRVRRILPPMGPVDFGPLAALFMVWLARSIAMLLFAMERGATRTL
ncbi:MAG TPA: YggT family protein [Candidatus Hydrogenedentes bacterium]|mgnify:CR=1 FL=1|jgi:YggT family protein|nr:YggT family protein [Candidatus Hydrogenedentota bacterium]